VRGHGEGDIRRKGAQKIRANLTVDSALLACEGMGGVLKCKYVCVTILSDYQNILRMMRLTSGILLMTLSLREGEEEKVQICLQDG
jgi:hypothetical protein